MLDAFIIDRIRRQPPPRETAQIPLHIEVPPPPPVEPAARPSPSDHEEQQRGIITVDFSI